jgi:rhamnosyltransferase
MGKRSLTVTHALVYNLTLYQGEVFDYVLYCLKDLRSHFDRILVVLNEPANEAGTDALKHYCDDILIKDTSPYNALAGYQAGLKHMGWDYLDTLSELTVMDSDLIGPLYPYQDMVAKMAKRPEADLWSLSSRLEDDTEYLVSSLVVFRQSALRSAAFKSFWSSEIPEGTDIPSHSMAEQNLTNSFVQAGCKEDAFLRPADYDTEHPLRLDIVDTLEKDRNPFVLISSFSGSPALLDIYQPDLHRVIPYLDKHSEYPTSMFWPLLLKITPLRSLHTSLAYQFTFDSTSYGKTPDWDPDLKIAVCAHVYYTESFEEIYERACNIPHAYDLYMTTASEEKKSILEEKCASLGIEADVRVVGQNRGRDMSSLFIDLKDVVVSKDYDLICRLHSKKSPQVHPSTGRFFKNYIFDSILASREYTSHLLDFFAAHPHVGMAFPPLIHTGYRSMGHAWYVNHGIFAQILSELDYTVPEEPYSPLSPYGTVFWFRPDALRPMFEDRYKYEDYNKEPNHVDGSLAHGQERVMSYIAQARGYMSATIWPDFVAAQSTTLMEYKMDSLYSHFPQRYAAPHSTLMSYVKGEKRTWRTPKTLRQFEEYCRPTVKKVGAALGIKTNKTSRKKTHSRLK